MSKCFYHSRDLDGHCSGAIVKMAHPDVELIGIDYGDAFPWDSIKKGEEIFMVDFSIQPFEDMRTLNHKCNLTWIDHHKSAIEEYEDWKKYFPEADIKGKRVDGRAACVLCWEFFFTKPVPRAIEILGRYDVWDDDDKDEWEKVVLPFQWGMRTIGETRPESNPRLWKEVVDGYDTEDIIRAGEQILAYQRKTDRISMASGAFETELPVRQGLKIIACNTRMTNSMAFESVYDPEVHGAMCSFAIRKDGRWNFSLYTTRDDIDVSAIAKEYGGGGHKQAAGFQLDELPKLFLPKNYD